MLRTPRTLSLLLAGTAFATPTALSDEVGSQEARQETVIVVGTPIRDSQIASDPAP